MSDTRRAPVDKRMAWKIVVSVVTVVTAVGGLLYASTLEGAEYYKFVDEVMADPGALQGKRVRVHGMVAANSLEKARDSLHYRFKIESPANRPTRAIIDAEYRGLVPDTFKTGSEVVATGRLTADNRLVADKIEAKCPSKYEAKASVGDVTIPETKPIY